MGRVEDFELENNGILKLDFQGYTSNCEPMRSQYVRRNSFGLDQDKVIHRIFQKKFLEKDILDGFLTLPRASASVWNDPLEIPLADVKDIDPVTGCIIHLGALVSNFYALCWTARAEPLDSDWSSFSHGEETVRISTTVGKLMDRLMRVDDPLYMHRTWLIEVDYKDSSLIENMKNSDEVYRRMESAGALLALSAAVVRSEFSTEDEVRLLFDGKLAPLPLGSIVSTNPDLVRIPFRWEKFIESRMNG